MIEEEESITRALTQDTKLQSVADLYATSLLFRTRPSSRGKNITDQCRRAKGVEYKKSLRTTWRPPGWAEKYTEREVNKMRNDEGILVQGEGIPPPLFSFEVNIVHLPKNLYLPYIFLGDENTSRNFESFEKERDKKTYTHSNTRLTLRVR